jgi:hypothetical protein
MKRTVLLIIIILTLPALCHGSVSPEPVLELSGDWYQMLDLDLDVDLELLPKGTVRFDVPGLDPSLTVQGPNYTNKMVSPDNMISMASFIWAELTGSVDIVSEVRTFSRQWRRNGRRARAAVNRNAKRNSDTRSRWKIVVGCRIDDNMELAARFDTRGNLLNEKRVAWQLSAADVFPKEVGLTTVYRNGNILLEAEDVNLTDDATVKVVVRF